MLDADRRLTDAPRVTHEYTILHGGTILSGAADASPATAIAYAHGIILAVGDDASVRSVSRGDSTFVDLEGLVVVPLAAVERGSDSIARLPRAVVDPAARRGAILTVEGDDDAAGWLVPGSPADLAILSADPTALPRDRAGEVAVVATVRAGRGTGGPFGAGHHDPSTAAPRESSR